MALAPVLPRAQAPLAERSAPPTREWYDFFRNLLRFAETLAGVDGALITDILNRLDQLEADSLGNFQIQGLMTVKVTGTPQSGIVQLRLDNDVNAPGVRFYYGTDASGAKGFFSLDALYGAALATGGTTAQFWRGDKTWSGDLLGRLGVNAVNVSELASGLLRVGGSFSTAATNNVRGVRMDADAALGSGFAMSCFDAAGSTSGANPIDHLIGFQSRPTHGGSGLMTRLQGFGSLMATNGPVTAAAGFYMYDTVGTGAVTNQFGLYMEAMTKGSANNFAIWVDGNNPSVFGGPVFPKTTGSTNLGDASLKWNSTFTYNLLVGNSAPSLGGSAGTMFLSNAAAIPSSNPVGGIVIYAEAGAGKARGTSGTITTWAPAKPHCPECKSDFVHEWESPVYGYLATCMNCRVDGVNSFTRVKGAWDKEGF